MGEGLPLRAHAEEFLLPEVPAIVWNRVYLGPREGSCRSSIDRERERGEGEINITKP